MIDHKSLHGLEMQVARRIALELGYDGEPQVACWTSPVPACGLYVPGFLGDLAVIQLWLAKMTREDEVVIGSGRKPACLPA